MAQASVQIVLCWTGAECGVVCQASDRDWSTRSQGEARQTHKDGEMRPMQGPNGRGFLLRCALDGSDNASLCGVQIRLTDEVAGEPLCWARRSAK